MACVCLTCDYAKRNDRYFGMAMATIAIRLTQPTLKTKTSSTMLRKLLPTRLTSTSTDVTAIKEAIQKETSSHDVSVLA